MIEKNPVKKYKYGCPGITYDSNRGDYACYINDRFLRRGFEKVEDAIEYRNKTLNSNGLVEQLAAHLPHKEAS